MNEQFGIVRSLFYNVRIELYPRIGHRVIFFQHQLLIFGGLTATGEYNGTVIRIDCQTMAPDIIKTKNNLQLMGFSIFNIDKKIFFWGGSGPHLKDPKQTQCQNKLIAFQNEQFYIYNQYGKIPSAREHHSSCIVANKGLIIMGGNNGKIFFNDWHFLEFKSMTWSKINVDQQIPVFMDSLLFWKAGRGFLLTGEFYSPQKNNLMGQNKIYQFKFIDFKQKKMRIEEANIAYDYKQKYPRGSPVACLVTLESPYIALLGGTKVTETGQYEICNNVECYNIQTMQWFSLNHCSMAGASFEAIYEGEKIYMVGGLNRNKQIFQHVEYVQLKVQNLEAKVCQSCRQIYGLRSLLENQNTSLKFESAIFPKTFLSSQIVGKFSSYMNYPFQAFGLLIDNCLNLSGSTVDIKFGKVAMIEGMMDVQKPTPFDYISIIDNSMGFNSFQILDTLCSFTLKTQKYTSDKRYEEQIQIRKEYGINLKLGALRLGKSCLYVTKVYQKQEKSMLIAYFSTTSAFSQSPFSVTYYTINESGQCSSQVARHLIEVNVAGKIPQYETRSEETKVYIFDFERSQFDMRGQQKSQVWYNYASSKIYRSLSEYAQSLYLKPYTGRTIRINGKQIRFRQYLDMFKGDQIEGRIAQLTEEECQMDKNQSLYFQRLKLYRIIDKEYFLRDILCYHNNRLLFTIKGPDDRYCGVIQFNQQVRIDVCKTKLQNRAQQLTFSTKIKQILSRHKEKMTTHLPSKSKIASSPLFQRNSTA